jgi:hypothetical protein
VATHFSARWSAWDGEGLEDARITLGSDGVKAKGEIASEPGGKPWARYELECDPAWRTRRVAVSLMDGRRLLLVSDGAGTWTRDGEPVPELSGAVDVDLSGTPLTNTLPIRRLALAIGARARIHCAYVDLPSLAVSLEAQRYTRLGEGRYHFESAAHGFARDIEVDEAGLVVSYPGLFRRVG